MVTSLFSNDGPNRVKCQNCGAQYNPETADADVCPVCRGEPQESRTKNNQDETPEPQEGGNRMKMSEEQKRELWKLGVEEFIKKYSYSIKAKGPLVRAYNKIKKEKEEEEKQKHAAPGRDLSQRLVASLTDAESSQAEEIEGDSPTAEPAPDGQKLEHASSDWFEIPPLPRVDPERQAEVDRFMMARIKPHPLFDFLMHELLPPAGTRIADYQRQNLIDFFTLALRFVYWPPEVGPIEEVSEKAPRGETEKQDVARRMITECLKCRHFGEKKAMLCDRPLAKCPNPKVRRWREELEV